MNDDHQLDQAIDAIVNEPIPDDARKRVIEKISAWRPEANVALPHNIEVADETFVRTRSWWLRVVPVLVVVSVGLYFLNLQHQKQINLANETENIPDVIPRKVKEKTPSTLVDNKPSVPNVMKVPVEKKTDMRLGLLRQRNMQIKRLLEEI